MPEGIIFQEPERLPAVAAFILLDESLVAVISLPGGVFNPYSGVKTSILILDKVLAPKTDYVGFFKVENDGYDLGAQRRPVGKDDLPVVADEISEYLRRLRAGDSLDDFAPQTGLLVDKDWIADNGDYNLSGERYRENEARSTVWPMAELRNVAHIESGSRQKGGALSSGVPSIGGEQINNDGDLRLEKMKYVSKEHFTQMKKGVLQKGDVLLVKDGATTGKTAYFDYEFQAAVNEHVFILRAKESTIPQYLYRVVRTNEFQQTLHPYIKGIIGGISLEVGSITIPLPPLEVQRELVAEIESYQRVMDGARAVVDNWRPQFVVSTEWPTIALGDVCTLIAGQHIDKDDYNTNALGIGYLTGPSDFGDVFPEFEKWTTTPKVIAQEGDILITVKGSGLGKVNLLSAFRAAIGRQLMAIRATGAITEYLYIQLMRMYYDIQALGIGAAIPGITKDDVLRLRLPLPPLTEQESIVATWKREMELVNGNRELVERMEQRIQDAIARVWEG